MDTKAKQQSPQDLPKQARRVDIQGTRRYLHLNNQTDRYLHTIWTGHTHQQPHYEDIPIGESRSWKSERRPLDQNADFEVEFHRDRDGSERLYVGKTTFSVTAASSSRTEGIDIEDHGDHIQLGYYFTFDGDLYWWEIGRVSKADW
ncbi:hypothetical protein VT84_32740 [Gemmata sp. SH-PL17]|uniref:hypothetical protein n=1 Tax=Gemmata sp. SH-PL17 TaxID=1630693 RepID=UPI000696D94A|nr:hypothetical protein [Gemmata sp. SH-PL17]AMV29208.1 hypothetical protein VT84_32740 [Gemmata sp. SH-PL17]